MDEVVDIKQFFKILWKRKIFILSMIVLTTVTVTILSIYVMKPIYRAQTQILINQMNQNTISYETIESELQLINTYNIIMKSPRILEQVIEQLNLNISPEQLTKMITLKNEENSKIINIFVEHEDQKKAVEIANTLAHTFKEDVTNLMKVDHITILLEAKVKKDALPVKPNIPLNIAIAIIGGFMLGSTIAFVLEITNTKFKNEEEIEEHLQMPIVGYVSFISEFNEQSFYEKTKVTKGG